MIAERSRVTVTCADAARGAPSPAAPRPSLLGAGERLARTPWIVVGLLGQGGMGEVYEVEHVELGRRAAIKVLHRQHRDRLDLAVRLRQEARLLATLGHPNIVEVFDLGMTTDGRPFFAMPLLRGSDLREHVARRGLPPVETAVGWAVQALDALGAAHAAGLVHRDVKLENLFLQGDGTLRLLDFGVAKAAPGGGSGSTSPGSSPGTPRTMAPEQCAGEIIDARADLYALGLVLYELCAGRGPFDDVRSDAHALRWAHCERVPAPPSSLAPRPLPPGLDAVILRALAKDPASRYPSAAAMVAALRPFLAGPASEAARTPRRRGRRRAAPARAAAVSALAVAFLALGLSLGGLLQARSSGFGAPLPGAARKL